MVYKLTGLIALGVLAAAVGTCEAQFSWDRIKYVYAFGDSYSFVQGTHGHANFRLVGCSSVGRPVLVDPADKGGVMQLHR